MVFNGRLDVFVVVFLHLILFRREKEEFDFEVVIANRHMVAVKARVNHFT